ncbi:aminoglycoside 3-N-acetyltransferase [Microvirga sp. 2TAF3]|uniref:aminoglycoside 3-N-acetyltransferase n=1 Tax=Microvirga sp. 2TAF3 TaxID=3233014 RepID=UPI003F959277
MTDAALFRTRASLREDIRRLGVNPGDIVMAHAAVSRVGRLLNGPDALIGALLDTTGPDGTILAYTDWDACYDELLDQEGHVPAEWREHIPPYDAGVSRAARDNGVLAEFLRTWPSARRSGNPAASVAAVGAKADWITSDHPLDYGYGEGSPLAKLVAARGKVLMIGAPFDTMTLLHHAEHLARIPGKRIRRYEVPFATKSGTQWRMAEEFETSLPVVSGLGDDYFTTLVAEFLAMGRGVQGHIGDAPATTVEAAAITAFAVDWLESRFGRSPNDAQGAGKVGP